MEEKVEQIRERHMSIRGSEFGRLTKDHYDVMVLLDYIKQLKAELEEAQKRERAAFEAGRKQQPRYGPSGEYQDRFRYRTFEDYLAEREKGVK